MQVPTPLLMEDPLADGSSSDDPSCREGRSGPSGRRLPASAVFRRASVGACALVAVGVCAWLGTGSRRPVAGAGGTVSLYDLGNIAEGYRRCFQNKSYYTETTGKHSMLFGQRSQEISPYACQFRCALTPGCAHFSFWSDGGCLLTSYLAYPQLYMGPDSMGVIAGPRSCSSVLVEQEEPQLHLAPAVGLPAWATEAAEGCGGLHSSYTLSWKAQGRTFFDDWQFLTKSETHGAEWYLNKSEAFRNGVVLTNDQSAVMRVGDQVMPFKRQSVMIHSAQAWRPDRGFIVAMKYRHVPYGVGIWPAFWLMNSDYLWPGGGELDILEYANEDSNKITFHTNKNCSLHPGNLNRCMDKPGVDTRVISDCYTNYTSNYLGCKPPQIRHNGKWFAEHPGVIATVWDASGVYVFHIPEEEIPMDLQSEAPNPKTWDKWMIAYLPFEPSSCFDIAKPQEIVLNIALCGDWAGGAWWNSPEAKSTGFTPPYCIPGHVTEPATDCCTIYMSHPTSEHQIKSTAFFDIEYMKVFEPAGVEPSRLAAGTYRNGGEPLEAPCVPCGSSREIPFEEPGGGNICCPGCGEGVFSLAANGTLTCPAAA